MFNPLLLLAVLIISSPAFSEEQREVATDSASIYNVASINSERSFFEPKTKADVDALATLDSELTKSLGQETPN